MQVCSRLGLLDLFRLLFFTLVHEAIRVILLVPVRITFTHICSSVSENLDSPSVARISAATARTRDLVALFLELFFIQIYRYIILYIILLSAGI